MTATVKIANSKLIRLNKLVSWLNNEIYILFFY